MRVIAEPYAPVSKYLGSAALQQAADWHLFRATGGPPPVQGLVFLIPAA